MRKKLLSLLLSGIMIFQTISPVYAATETNYGKLAMESMKKVENDNVSSVADKIITKFDLHQITYLMPAGGDLKSVEAQFPATVPEDSTCTYGDLVGKYDRFRVPAVKVKAEGKELKGARIRCVSAVLALEGSSVVNFQVTGIYDEKKSGFDPGVKK